MKKLLYILIVTLSIGSIIFGHFYWKAKISDNHLSSIASAENTSNTTENVAEKKSKESKKKPTKNGSKQPNYKELTGNMTSELQNLILQKIDAGEPIKLAIIGSGAQTKGSTPWPSLFKERLNQAYGTEVFDIVPTSFGDGWSIEIIYGDKFNSVVETSPDIVLLEPFLLNDNADINIDDTLASIRYMNNRFLEQNGEMVLLLQPPHPVFEPSLYLSQVESLKEFAKEKGHIYLNHWEDWPDSDNAEIKNYLLTDGSGPVI
ncbi:SGNH/GDSL hydrolase family protein [Pseudalkalibacillus decolorationis]|uniref:SGNH/GDSL hydrolase family protein n=1 Tax=Pseudalkalibacillus decolorationis TaxID=163879 RepID=UPI002148A2D9|nr:SGNH/GDSL hydrolase family protein [Pseudalkalibacillus decolorationis]